MAQAKTGYFPLTREREMELGRLWQTTKDPKAIDELVGSHQRLVWKIARGYKNYGHPLNDLFQEGCLGLIIAAQKFDPGKNVRFATYATSWIRAYILKFILTNRGPINIDKSGWQRNIFFNLEKTRRQIEKNCGQGDKPSTEQIARKLGVKVEQLERMMPRLSGIDPSLDAPAHNRQQRPYCDFLADASAGNPEQLVAQEEAISHRQELIKKCLAALNPRERDIIQRRFLGAKRETLVDIGRDLNISRERVRQLELQAKKKMLDVLRSMGEVPEDFLSS